MTTFFPGPSRVYAAVKQYMADAFEAGILSISHRSEAFNQLSADTIALLRLKLNIPNDYTIFYTSSATESWEIIAQSFTLNSSLHFYSGSFGEKWFQYAQKIKNQSEGHFFDLNESVVSNILSSVAHTPELLCLTQNETSNATQIQVSDLVQLRIAFPNSILAYDVTSSIGGIALPIDQGDIWFGSVQKCFGLPAGLGLLICSPRAIEKAKEIGEDQHYNSALQLILHMSKYQTTCTPNVLGIYLLNRVLAELPPIAQVHQKLKSRAEKYYQWLDKSNTFSPLVKNNHNRSDTVIAVAGTVDSVSSIKQKAKENGFLLGAGYGKWKENTFRIANFPALEDEEVTDLLQFLNHYA
jgi:phosphoserine aminotransferase